MIIENDEEHAAALEALDFLMEFARTEKEGQSIELLSKAIEAYELIHHPIADPTPEEAAAFRADQEKGTLCECEGAAVCGVMGGVKKEPIAGLCRALVCEKRGHLLVQKMTAVICDRCRIAVEERP